MEYNSDEHQRLERERNSENIPVIEDTLNYGLINACKHANGHDWWVVVPKYQGKGYYRVLITSDSISQPYFQPTNTYKKEDAISQVVFSPDGSKYILYNGDSPQTDSCRIYLYDFDRCTGLLLNEQKITLSVEFGAAGGVAVSPNSRVLYVATAKRIDQFDLEAPDIGASRITVAEFDSTAENCGGYGKYYFFLGQLAPDGKVYFSVPYTQGDKLHVINYPDSLGFSCNAEVHAFSIFPTFYLPNHPNYYLGALPNPCPTVSVSEPSVKLTTVKVIPNPAKEYVTIELLGEFANVGTVTVYSTLGIPVQSFLTQVGQTTYTLNCQSWSAGVYSILYEDSHQKIITKMIVLP